MGYDTILKVTGDFGHYQRIIFALLCYQSFYTGLFMFASVFMSAIPKHRCKLPNETSKANYVLNETTKELWIPWKAKLNSSSSCTMYVAGIEVKCKEYVYDTSVYKSTTTTEFNIVCDKEYLHAISNSIFMIGTLIGCAICGASSDRVGRKPVLYAAVIATCFSGIITSFSRGYMMFSVCRALGSLSSYGAQMIGFVMVTEMVANKRRVITGIAYQWFFSVGYVFNTLFAYFIRDWRFLTIAISLPGIAFIPYYWIIPESTRWLIQENKLKRARRQIRRLAKINKVQLNKEELEKLLGKIEISKLSVGGETRHHLTEVFRYKKLTKCTFLICTLWFISASSYFGLSWSSTSLGENDFINFFLSGVAELPAAIFLISTMNRFGRKIILIISMVLSGILMILTAIVLPKESVKPQIIFSMFGKCMITACYNLLFVYTAELYPTVIRSSALGLASTCAQVGSILTPFLFLLARVWRPLPIVILGTVNFLCGLASLTLPETLNKELPDTLQDAEIFFEK